MMFSSKVVTARQADLRRRKNRIVRVPTDAKIEELGDSVICHRLMEYKQLDYRRKVIESNNQLSPPMTEGRMNAPQD